MTTAATTTAVPKATAPPDSPRGRGRSRIKSVYPSWFYIPAIALYTVFFAVPTFASFYFSLTRWSLIQAKFIGLANFAQFFQDPQLVNGFVHTFIFGFVTCGAKVVLGFALAVVLTSPVVGRGYLRAVIFFPVLVSAIGVGIMFKSLLDPFHGMVNALLGALGLPQPGWLTDPSLALYTVAGIDVWKGLGIATLIFMAGIVAIPSEYFEAAKVDGANSWQILRSITIPLSRPAMGTVLVLSLIGGLRSFDLIWATTGGGPGFTSDVIASVIYKEYQAGFFGLSTAGNVVLFLVVTAVVVPISYALNRKKAEL